MLILEIQRKEKKKKIGVFRHFLHSYIEEMPDILCCLRRKARIKKTILGQ